MNEWAHSYLLVWKNNIGHKEAGYKLFIENQEGLYDMLDVLSLK